MVLQQMLEQPLHRRPGCGHHTGIKHQPKGTPMAVPSACALVPRPTLATIIERVGVKDLRLEERLCDAAFHVARRSLNTSHRALRGKAAIRVAGELEEALRATFRPSKRVWRWTPKQRRLLASQILASPPNRSTLEDHVRLRCEALMYETMQRSSYQAMQHIIVSSYHDMRDLFYGFIVSLTNRGFITSEKEYRSIAKLLIACDLVWSALLGEPN